MCVRIRLDDSSDPVVGTIMVADEDGGFCFRPVEEDIIDEHVECVDVGGEGEEGCADYDGP